MAHPKEKTVNVGVGVGKHRLDALLAVIRGAWNCNKSEILNGRL